MDLPDYNRKAWDAQVAKGNRWTVPVGPDEIAAARRGEWRIVLTPTRPVPREWFGEVAGRDVLCLASGGGQQGPILAAAGARVVVLDLSPAQVQRDRDVAAREGLSLTAVEGDMRDLSRFSDGTFDLIVHPISNCFLPDVRPMWREAFRVLKAGGALLAGFCNPILYVFDDALADKGELAVRHSIPYSDLTSLSDEERRRYTDANEPLVFGHSLEDQIGGQLQAGFVLTGMYEDRIDGHPLSKYVANCVATRALKPGERRTT
jgi:SAM-dependent methyltransferase